jgi:hypothetical protein
MICVVAIAPLSLCLCCRRELGERFERIELHRFAAAFDRRLQKLMTGDIQSGKRGRLLRDDGDAVIVLGQAFEPRAGIHRVADGGDDCDRGGPMAPTMASP